MRKSSLKMRTWSTIIKRDATLPSNSTCNKTKINNPTNGLYLFFNIHFLLFSQFPCAICRTICSAVLPVTPSLERWLHTGSIESPPGGMDLMHDATGCEFVDSLPLLVYDQLRTVRVRRKYVSYRSFNSRVP